MVRKNIKSVSFLFLLISISIFCPAWSQTSASIDSVWFWEETDCNDSNVVFICYILESSDSSLLFDVTVAMSGDSGATWDVPLVTLLNAEGAIGHGVMPDTHCFEWVMSEDIPDSEAYNWMVDIHAISFFLIDSFSSLDTAQYVINGNDGFVPPDSEYFVLTQNLDWRNGRLMTIDTFLCDTLNIEFDFSMVPGWCDLPAESTGADGISLIFSPLLDPPLSPGSGVGIIGCEGWGIEFDTYNNNCGHAQSDISGNHIAVSLDSTACLFVGVEPVPLSLIQIDVPFDLVDIVWHHVEVEIEYPNCRVILDGVPYIDGAFPDIPAPFRAHIGLSASTGDCMSEHRIDNLLITRHPLEDTVTANGTAPGPLDSRPPRVEIDCPDDINVHEGDTISLSWSVEDLFWNDDPFNVIIDWCTGDSVLVIDDTFLTVEIPSICCDSIYFIIEARDSFCNWGYDTCSIKYCPLMNARVQCGPCGMFTACYDQILSFIVIDSMCGNIVDSAFATVRIFHESGDSSIQYIAGPSSNLSITDMGDSTGVVLQNIVFSTGDSVVVTLDSLLSGDCVIVPAEY